MISLVAYSSAIFCTLEAMSRVYTYGQDPLTPMTDLSNNYHQLKRTWLWTWKGRLTPSGLANALDIFHQCSMTAADADPTNGARNANLIADLTRVFVWLELLYKDDRKQWTMSILSD